LKEYLLKTSSKMNYLLYIPSDHHKGKKWPLLIFLHGYGEQGDDLEKVKRHGPTRRIREGHEFPFIVAAPQCPKDSWWSISELDQWLDFLIKELPVNERQIYLTGLSMGGFGTWAWAIDRPDRFGAIAPVCGGGESFLAWRIKDIPIWVFHGAKDDVLPIRRSQEMVDALKKYKADIKFTVYADAGHDSWTETYANPDLYKWFLKHKKLY
jgi:predicted peptidase